MFRSVCGNKDLKVSGDCMCTELSNMLHFDNLCNFY